MSAAQKIDIPIEKVSALCERYHVKELALFGSAVTGRLKRGSDIDFLVEFKPEARIGFVALSKMQRELTVLMRRKVDLVSKGGLKPILRKEIISTMSVLYAA
jgi:predicted nucleotidyltransferase